MKRLYSVLGRGLIGLSLLLAAGCAGSATSVPPGQQTAPVSEQYPYVASWIGDYEGTGDVLNARAAWKREERIKLRVAHVTGNRLEIRQQPLNGRYFKDRGFGPFTVDLVDATTIMSDTDFDRRYYRFSKKGDAIKGHVKIWEKATRYSQPTPAYEWIFTASKVLEP